MAKKDDIRREILACRDRHGRITRKAVVDRARSPRNILHDQFEWNNQRAAEKHRLDRAGELIRRYITIMVVHKNVKIRSVGYVKDPLIPHQTPGYTSLADADRASAEMIIVDEIGRCESAIKRARSVAGVLDKKFPGLLQKLESALLLLIEARSELKRAA